MMRDMQDSLGAGASGTMEASEGDASGAAEVDMADCASLALPPDPPPYTGDYIVSDYMERLGTRLNILEAELKYAWRALDLLSQEYVRMWERLEKLESLLADQQGVISTLLDFYTCRSVTNSRDPMTRLEVIREILGNGTVEDGIEEGLDVGRTSVLMDVPEESFESDEAFYRSLNQAYRDDLVCEETSRPPSQLDMIWEAPEDVDIIQSASNQIYSASDYKNYRGDSPCISDRDLAQLSTIDQITVDKLHELDRLTSQLHKDSRELKDLKTRLLSPEHKMASGIRNDKDIEVKALVEDGNIINEQLRHMSVGAENWGFTDAMKSFDEMLLTMPKENSTTQIIAERSPSRISLVESVTSDKGNDYLSGSSISPRRKYFSEKTSTEPYTTVTGRLAYSSAVANAEINAAKLSKSPNAHSRERFEYSAYDSSVYQKYLSNISGSEPFEVYKPITRPHSPTMSLQNVLNEQTSYESATDSRLNLHFCEERLAQSPSPPPPAPPNGAEMFTSTENNRENMSGRSALLSATSPLPTEHMRLSPRSPRSPKSSPKHLKREPTNIVPAKSDSGLSSMSGWSSLEKSPGSPKTNKLSHNAHDIHKIRMSSPQNLQKSSNELDMKPYLETLVDSYAYSGNKSPKNDHNFHKQNYMDKDANNKFKVNEPRDEIDESILKNEMAYQNITKDSQQANLSDYIHRTEPPAIYSVAGNRQPNFTTVYSTSRGTLEEGPNFPDIIELRGTMGPVKPIHEIYPPEPSYHAQTSLYTSTTTSVPSARRNLTRTSSIGSAPVDGNVYQNVYKSNTHRTVYPPSNITDALSYYPTSTRYESCSSRPSVHDYTEEALWQTSCRSPSSSIDTSSMTSQTINNAERMQYQNQLQQEYFRQQQYDQRNGNTLYENTRLDNTNEPQAYTKCRKDQYVESSGILVSQSGYLSIASNLRGKQLEKQSKKPKRTSSLKSAMTSMSHWLPDLHLPKKSRSHSLPSGVDNVEEQSHKSLKERVASAQRRKKKYHLVASMSGLLQKARRKQHTSHQSLSDPETSETEWSGGRSSAQSEDSDSVFSDSAHENNVFAKVITNNQQRKLNHQEIIEQQQKIQELQKQGYVFQKIEDAFEAKEEIEEEIISESIPRDKSDDIDFHFAKLSNQMNKDEIAELQKLDIDTDISDVGPYEDDGNKSSGSHSGSSIFATIGDVKRAAAASDESSDGKSYSGGGPMEFAVSRALGKYRLRKSSSVSDDQISETSPPKSEPGDLEDQTDFQLMKERKPRKQSPPEIISSTVLKESASISESSPSTHGPRGYPNKFLPRHQQSLDIPTARHDDDDNRSTHSWRSGSRVSSRRQSTEDSIDSEDEWYCYELRKLEEMEHQSQLEADRENTLSEEPELEAELSVLEPEEDMKEKMSFVLRELKLKTASVKSVMDDGHEEKMGQNESENRIREPLSNESALLEQDKEDEESFVDSFGSGETSGPDSPVQSGDELDEDFEEPRLQTESSKPETSTTQDVPAGSKWKLLKALKDRKAEEKGTTEPPATATPTTEKDKVSAGVSYIMQKLYEIRVKS